MQRDLDTCNFLFSKMKLTFARHLQRIQKGLCLSLVYPYNFGMKLSSTDHCAGHT